MDDKLKHYNDIFTYQIGIKIIHRSNENRSQMNIDNRLLTLLMLHLSRLLVSIKINVLRKFNILLLEMMILQ